MFTSCKTGRVYAALRDVPDSRDLHVSLAPVNLAPAIHPSGNKAFLGPVKNQGNEGCCTGFGNAGMREFLYRKYYEFEKDKTVDPSKFVASAQFAYWNARAAEGTTKQDSGAGVRDAVKGINQFGVCLESDLPYRDGSFYVTPTPQQFAAALKYKAGAYHAVPSDVETMKSVLASGYVFTQGIDVYESFEDDYTARCGIMLLPNTQFEQYMGGHCTLVYDFDDKNEWFICRNSWGTNWGSDGDFFMPYKLVTMGLAHDMWIQHLGKPWAPAVEKVETPAPAVTEATPEIEPTLVTL